MKHHRWSTGAVLCALLLAGCQGEDTTGDDVARGGGLRPAALPAAAQARVYEAATRAALEVGPSLTLLMHPRLLPATAGYTGGQPVPPEVERALRERGIVRGTCETPTDTARPKRTPTCEARAPGYVVRFSDVFQLGPDSVQVYFAAERYDTPASGAHEVLRLEKAYQLAKRGGTWRVVREARVPGSSK